MVKYLQILISGLVLLLAVSAPSAQTEPAPADTTGYGEFITVGEVFEAVDAITDSLVENRNRTAKAQETADMALDSATAVAKIAQRASTGRFTGKGSNFLDVVANFAHAYRDSVELDAFAAEKGISREEAAETEEWKALKKSFRTRTGRRETAEMYLGWLENGGKAGDILSATGVQTPPRAERADESPAVETRTAVQRVGPSQTELDSMVAKAVAGKFTGVDGKINTLTTRLGAVEEALRDGFTAVRTYAENGKRKELAVSIGNALAKVKVNVASGKNGG